MITQPYIDGYISSLNNLLFIYRNQLVSLRKAYYFGSISNGVFLNIPRFEYKITRKLIFENIKTIHIIKENYKNLIKDINKLTK